MLELNLANLEMIYYLLQETKNSTDKILSDFELDDNVEPAPEKRQLLNIILDKTSAYLKVISHIDAFLRSCDLLENGTLNAKQQSLIIECQLFCQSQKASSKKVLQWVVKTKGRLNEAQCLITPHQDDTQENEKSLLQIYHKTQAILKEIHSDLILLDSENMITTAGKQLQVMEGKKLFLNTEHEMNVFMDFAIFQYCKDGKNIVQRYYELHSSLYTGASLTTLTAFKNTRFSFLKIIRYVEPHGLIVHDPLIGKNFLMIDKGLNTLAKRDKNYAILTHYLCLPKFTMTTGAPAPIILTSEVGKQMQSIFNNLIFHHQKRKLLNEKTYKQCITDLYKIALHNDTTKIVASRELPMSHYQLNKERLFIN